MIVSMLYFYMCPNSVQLFVFEFSPYRFLEVWNDFTATTNRTIKSCDSFHVKLNAFFHSVRPYIFMTLFWEYSPINTYII